MINQENQTTKKVVVIGGGTGSYVLLSGLKNYPIDLSAVISVADSGGSTGRLRDEFGFQPVGDLRQALAALAKDEDQGWIKKLLLYRFEKGKGLEGHNLGNLILTALQDLSHSTAEALEIAESIFRLHGHIYPITITTTQLVIEYSDGTVIIGEHNLDDDRLGGTKIASVKMSPRATIYPKAKEAIIAADLIVIAPGDLYGSIMPSLVVEGTKDAFAKTQGKVVYVQNLMTRYTQTHNMTSKDHVDVIEEAIGRHINQVIINNAPIPETIKQTYQLQNEYEVIDSLEDSTYTHIIKAPLITEKRIEKHNADSLPRSYLRHDSDKIAALIMNLLGR